MNSIDRHWKRLEENKERLDTVNALLESCDDLNNWEDSFLESVRAQLMEGRNRLSERQLAQIERLEYLNEFGRDAYWDEFGDGRYSGRL